MWAALAYNEFWGFMGGYFSIVEGVINLAVFPTVTLDYVMVLPVARTRAFWHQDLVAKTPLANLAVFPTVTLDYGMVHARRPKPGVCVPGQGWRITREGSPLQR